MAPRRTDLHPARPQSRGLGGQPLLPLKYPIPTALTMTSRPAVISYNRPTKWMAPGGLTETPRGEGLLLGRPPTLLATSRRLGDL